MRPEARHLWIGGVALASALTACQPQVIGDASPGFIRIVSVPRTLAMPLTIRFRDPKFGTLSTVSFDFDASEPILIVFPSTPSAPGNTALQVNEMRCEGTWSIASKMETDVLLHVDGSSCWTEVVGTHVVGAVHTDPQTEPNVDSVK